MRKRLWSPEEDEKLHKYVTENGYGNWSEVAKKAGLQRCGKSCRLRWINYLRPNLKRGKFTAAEKMMIIGLQKVFGNSWSKIAVHLPGRTDSDIKNFWHSHFRKKQPLQLVGHHDLGNIVHDRPLDHSTIKLEDHHTICTSSASTSRANRHTSCYIDPHDLQSLIYCKKSAGYIAPNCNVVNDNVQYCGASMSMPPVVTAATTTSTLNATRSNMISQMPFLVEDPDQPQQLRYSHHILQANAWMGIDIIDQADPPDHQPALRRGSKQYGQRQPDGGLEYLQGLSSTSCQDDDNDEDDIQGRVEVNHDPMATRDASDDEQKLYSTCSSSRSGLLDDEKPAGTAKRNCYDHHTNIAWAMSVFDGPYLTPAFGAEYNTENPMSDCNTMDDSPMLIHDHNVRQSSDEIMNTRSPPAAPEGLDLVVWSCNNRRHEL